MFLLSARSEEPRPYTSKTNTSKTRLARVTLLCLASCVLMVLAACQPKTPAEQAAAARAQYTVELKSWFPRQPEPVAEPVADEAVPGEEAASSDASEDAAADPAADASADAPADTLADASEEAIDGEMTDEGGEAAAEPAAPEPVEIFFDLVVLFRGDNPLPGLTLDVSHAAADGTEKSSWRHYVELPKHIKGETMQVSFTTKDVAFVEGDQFSVVLETAVPPEEQPEYREFSTSAP